MYRDQLGEFACIFTYRENSADEDEDEEDLPQKTSKQDAPHRSSIKAK